MMAQEGGQRREVCLNLHWRTGSATQTELYKPTARPLSPKPSQPSTPKPISKPRFSMSLFNKGATASGSAAKNLIERGSVTTSVKAAVVDGTRKVRHIMTPSSLFEPPLTHRVPGRQTRDRTPRCHRRRGCRHPRHRSAGRRGRTCVGSRGFHDPGRLRMYVATRCLPFTPDWWLTLRPVSAAAGIQSCIGSVAAGGPFAVLQSAAAGGYGVAIVNGAVQGGGAALASLGGLAGWFGGRRTGT